MTMQDAAEYITALPEAERNAPEWQIALEAERLVAKRNGSEILARMAILQALKRAKPAPEPTPRWKFRIVRWRAGTKRPRRGAGLHRGRPLHSCVRLRTLGHRIGKRVRSDATTSHGCYVL